MLNYRRVLWRRVALLVCTVAFAVSAAGATDLRVRLVHGVPAAQAVSVAIGGAEVFSNVSYKDVTGWKELSVEREGKLMVTGSNGVRIESDREYEFTNDNEDYTILVMSDPERQMPVVRVIQTDRSSASSNEANISVINASAEVASANLAVDTNTLLSRVDPGELDGPVSVDAGAHTLRVTGSDNNVIAAIPMTARPAAAYSVVILGPSEAILVDEATAPTSEPVSEDSATTATEGATTGT